jgi:quinohemoprotein ethanol dehydrogenase
MGGECRLGVIAAPIAYRVDGTQYISIAVGWGGVVEYGTGLRSQLNPGTVLYNSFSMEKLLIPSFTRSNQGVDQS